MYNMFQNFGLHYISDCEHKTVSPVSNGLCCSVFTMVCWLPRCLCSQHNTFGFPPLLFCQEFFITSGKLHQWCLHVLVNLSLLHDWAISMPQALKWTEMQIWQGTLDLTPYPVFGSIWLEPQQCLVNVVWQAVETHIMWSKDIISLTSGNILRFLWWAGSKPITCF